ncbi:hypothetical protein BsWGS_23713 [Bradybaena similaris]
MLSSRNADVNSSIEKLLNLRLKHHSSQETDVSPSEETNILLSDEAPEVDTSTSQNIDALRCKKVVNTSSEDSNTFACQQTETLPDDSEHDKEKFNGRRSSSKYLNIGFYILVVGALVTCVASTALTIYLDVKFRHDGKTLQEPTGTSERNFSQGVCVQCIKLVQDPFNHLQADPLIDKLVKQVDDGFQMCCAENEDQMSAMVEAITREQVTKPIPRTDNENDNTGLKYVPISAHKQLLAGDDREYNVTEPYYGDGSEHFVVRLDPNYNDPLTEHAHGVTVLETALEVRHSGVYYVYFSVNLAPRPHDRLHHSVENWSQYVHRTRPNSPANSGLLLETSHTSCSDCRNHQESAFAGGTFALKKGDLIQVCISGLGLVQFRKESSFLGIIRLSHATA